MNHIPDSLRAYAQDELLPRYGAFDAAHGPAHAHRVIETSLRLAAEHGARADMAYLIAVYHDLGLSGGREGHEKASGALLAQDERLSRWFSAGEINLMREAVEDHRASSERAPRSLYGRIVAEADRDITYATIIERVVQYGLAQFPNYTRDEHVRRSLAHIEEKYGDNGYLKLWLETEENQRGLADLRRGLRDGTLEKDIRAALSGR